MWSDFDQIDGIHIIEARDLPDRAYRAIHEGLLALSPVAWGMHSALGREQAKTRLAQE